MVSSRYRISEVANGLLIKSHRDAARWQRLAGPAVAVMLVGIFSADILGGWWWTILAALAGAAAYSSKWGRNAQLLATSVEFVTTGNILHLEFRDYIISGLYAVTARGTHCILPFLDHQQTMEVIRAIEDRFPGLAEYWHKHRLTTDGTLFTSH